MVVKADALLNKEKLNKNKAAQKNIAFLIELIFIIDSLIK
jgi:hypothetical protein